MERLRQLLRLRAAIDAMGERLGKVGAHVDAEIEAERDAIDAERAEIVARRRRSTFKRIVLIPAGIGAAVAAVRDWLVAHHTAVMAAAGGVASGAAGAAIVITQLGPHHAAPQPPDAGPGLHASPTPHASRPPRTPDPTAAPTPPPLPPLAVPTSDLDLTASPSLPPRLPPSHPSLDPPSGPATTPPGIPVEDCRRRLPRLLCGRPR